MTHDCLVYRSNFEIIFATKRQVLFAFVKLKVFYIRISIYKLAGDKISTLVVFNAGLMFCRMLFPARKLNGSSSYDRGVKRKVNALR